MDNNFNNNQFEPEKPFTEKPNEPQPAPVFENENEDGAKAVDNAGENAQQFYDEPQNHYESAFPQNQPQQSDFAQQAPNFRQPQQNGYYQNNGGRQYNQNYNQPYGQPVNPQQPYYPQYGNPQANGRAPYQQAQPQYRQPQYPHYQQYPQYGQQNYQNSNFNQQQYQPYTQQGAPVNYSNTYAQPPIPNIPRKKMSPGIIVIIVVLSILCVGSLCGIVASIAANSSKSNNFSNSYTFTNPSNSPYFNNNSSTQEHSESDYSNKTNPSYEGIDLKAKPSDTKDSKYNTEYASNEITDSIVGVLCYSDEITDDSQCTSQGSGIIITSDGYVVTNSHVIGNSKTLYLIQIVTSDGKQYKAGVVGYDTRTDLALLKMDDASGLKAANFGNSKDVALGENVIAIGNPGGIKYSNSITQGIVSAVDRQSSITTNVKFIQTDAAINPGNSGGALVNMFGQVIGVSSSKIAATDYEGMGFAIPSATVKDVIDDIMKYGYVQGRVMIGVVGENVQSRGNIPAGIAIYSIDEDGPCGNTELKQNDIITGADGKKISNFAEFYDVLESHKAGDTLELEYYRTSDSSTGKVTITLQESK